jgi:hypothetical protein
MNFSLNDHKRDRRLSRIRSLKIGLGICLGGLLLLWLVVQPVRQACWRYFGKEFVQTTALVVDATAVGPTANINYTFAVDGKQYFGVGEAKQEAGGTVKMAVPIYYDPRNPSHNYTEYQSFLRRYVGNPLSLLLALMVAGGWLYSIPYYFIWGFVFGRAKE